MQTTDLSLSQKVADPDPDPVAAGQQIVYTTNVENLGPKSAGNVVVTDLLPANLIFVNGEPDCAESESGVVECAVGNLSVGEIREVRIVARIPANIACAPDQQFVEITNSAEVRKGAKASATF